MNLGKTALVSRLAKFIIKVFSNIMDGTSLTVLSVETVQKTAGCLVEYL